MIALLITLRNPVGRPGTVDMRWVQDAISVYCHDRLPMAAVAEGLPSCLDHTLSLRSADIEDRDGAPGVIEDTFNSSPTVVRFFAADGYSAAKLQGVISNLDASPRIEIVRRLRQATGFVVVAKRWVVERTFAWLGCCRRLAKDWENTILSSEAWLLITAI